MKFWRFGSKSQEKIDSTIKNPLMPPKSISHKRNLDTKRHLGMGRIKPKPVNQMEKQILAALKSLNKESDTEDIRVELKAEGIPYNGTKHKDWYTNVISCGLSNLVGHGLVKSKRTSGSHFVYWVDSSTLELPTVTTHPTPSQRNRNGFVDCNHCEKHLKGNTRDLKRHIFGAHGEEIIDTIQKKQTPLIQEVNEERLKILSHYLSNSVIEELQKRDLLKA